MADQCDCYILYVFISICVIFGGFCGILFYKIFTISKKRHEYSAIFEHGNGNEDEVQKFKEFYEDERRRKEEAINKYETYRDMYNEERREKEDALQRLSKLMSDRLTDGNPNIANLNDVKRPTKLAEELSELYDNEWTNAFDCIKTGEERVKIVFLLRILEIAFGWSKRHASGQLLKMKNLFVCPDMSDTTTMVIVSVNSDVMKRFKDERKLLAEKTVEYVSEKVLAAVKETFKGTNQAGAILQKPVKAYCRKCAELCWYIAIQDPQMDMKFSDVKRDDVKSYTKNGQEIDYIVWPPLYLQEKGSLMSKGIAQFRTNH